MKQVMALVTFVLAAFIGAGCNRPTPAVPKTSSDNCVDEENGDRRADCYATKARRSEERERLARELLESGSPPPDATHKPASPPTIASPTLLPPTAPAQPVSYAMFTTPVAGNAQNGCGSQYDLEVDNNTDYYEEVQAGSAFVPCGNGAALVIIMVTSAPGTQPRPAYVTPPGMKSYWTFDPMRGGHGKQTLLATAYPKPPFGPDGRFLPVAVMAAGHRPPVETELPYGAKGRRFPSTNSHFGL